MPIPNVKDSEGKNVFMERCVEQLKQYGHSPNEAKVICLSTWQESTKED